jgi:hypothetical protein
LAQVQVKGIFRVRFFVLLAFVRLYLILCVIKKENIQKTDIYYKDFYRVFAFPRDDFRLLKKE